MPSPDHLKAIGRALVARRTSLDPARHRGRDGWMTTVSTETSLSKRVIIDIETGARDNYSDETLASLERLYRLRPGSLQAGLGDTGPVLTEEGAPLLPDATPDPSPTRFRTDVRRSRLTGRVWQIVTDLEADTEGIPDEEADAMIERAMANAEAQARLMLDAERRRWERRQESDEAETQT